jgi:tRNA (cmo5U34)-methyltransferase
MKKDRLFQNTTKIKQFAFNKAVSDVFDDMLIRSIPHYLEIQTMISDFCHKFYNTNTTLYDLGCSTGNTYFTLNDSLLADFTYVGVDYSADMLAQFSNKLVPDNNRNVCLIEHDLNNSIQLETTSVVIINLTLQFLSPEGREKLLKNCFESLTPGGILIVIEKIKSCAGDFESHFTDKYYEFKKDNGYSELEIQRKKAALVGFLEPYTYDENVSLLKSVGFESVECFFRWYNFCGLIAIRQSEE